MKSHISLLYTIILTIISITFLNNALSQTTNSTCNGFWSDINTWDTKTIPTASDSVIITHCVLLDIDFTIQSHVFVDSIGELCGHNSITIDTVASLINVGTVKIDYIENYGYFYTAGYFQTGNGFVGGTASIKPYASFSNTNFTCEVVKLPYEYNDSSYCYGDTISITAPISMYYNWSNNETTQSILVFETGAYYVTVNDTNNCINISDTVKVAFNSLPKVKIQVSDFLCKNDSIFISTANNYVNYSWSGGNTSQSTIVDSAGLYWVLVTDSNQCMDSDSIQIGQINDPVANFSYSDTGLAVGFINLSLNADSYLWDFGDGNIDTVANPIHQYVQPGYYELCLTASGDCGNDTMCSYIMIGVDTSTSIIELSSQVQIYPNPNSGTLTIEAELQPISILQIQLINITGQIIYSESINASFYKKDIDLSGYAKGVYSLKVVSDHGVVCRKVVYR